MTTRVGLAGYGMAGRQIHAPILVRAGLEIAAVSTSSPERRAAVEEDHPGAVVVPDLEALLPPVLAGIAASQGLDPAFLATLDGEEMTLVRRAWPGGSIRRLTRLVETVVAAREALSRRH